jgi:hypothetical protein
MRSFSLVGIFFQMILYFANIYNRNSKQFYLVSSYLNDRRYFRWAYSSSSLYFRTRRFNSSARSSSSPSYPFSCRLLLD